MVDEHLLGEGRGTQALRDLGAAARMQRAVLVQPEHRLAEGRLAAAADVARAARAHQRDDHVIARREATRLAAHLLDDARRLVAVDGGKSPAPGARGVGDVAVADRAGGDAHAHLSGPGRSEVDVLDDERLAEAVADGCLHGAELYGQALRRVRRRRMRSRRGLRVTTGGMS